MTDARERRRANASTEAKTSPLEALKKFRVPIVIGIVWLAIISYNVAIAEGVIEASGDECPGHWHAGFSVWVGDDKVRFTERGPGGSAEISPAAGFHIHGDDGILHFHPGSVRCIAAGDALEKLGVVATPDSLVLDANQHINAGTYAENETHSVVLFHKEFGRSWKEVTNFNSVLSEQLGNGDQIMLAYLANDSALSIEDRQAQTTDLAGGNYDPGEASGVSDDVFIAITMTTVFAIVAIVIWFNFAKKTW